MFFFCRKNGFVAALLKEKQKLSEKEKKNRNSSN